MSLAQKRSLSIFLLFGVASRLLAGAGGIPNYKVGETAAEEVVSPVHLIVIDHERTEKLRQAEAQRDPSIFRFDPEASDRAEADLRAALVAGREEFLAALEATYGKRQLNEFAVTQPRFQRLVAGFQQQTKPFPLSTNLAQLWAQGGEDESMLTNLVSALRDVMTRYIRVDALPPEGRVGPRQVRMIRGGEAIPDLASIASNATNVFRTNIFTLSRARKELQESFAAEDRAVMGRFLAGFIRENCALDLELTRASRKKRTDGVWAADDYEPGQVILKRGELIDSRIKAVLDQLRERAAGVEARKDLARGQAEAQTTFSQLHDQAMRAQANALFTAEQNRWLIFAIGGASLAFLFVLWRLGRWKRAHSLLPARIHNDQVAGTVISCPSCTGTIILPLELSGHFQVPRLASAPPPPALAHPQHEVTPALTDDHYWKDRALAAEQRVQEAGQQMRRALIPHLAQWFTSRVVRGLVSNRKHLLETQRRAEQELAELEQRLVSVQAPLEDRLKAYEERIAELEKGLSAKGEENRELIKVTLAMAKKRLETERSKDRQPWT